MTQNRTNTKALANWERAVEAVQLKLRHAQTKELRRELRELLQFMTAHPGIYLSSDP